MTDRQQSSESPGPGVLERARIRAHLSARELWINYIALGGNGTPAELDTMLSTTADVDVIEYNHVVDVLNERFGDLGLDSSILYAVV